MKIESVSNSFKNYETISSRLDIVLEDYLESNFNGNEILGRAVVAIGGTLAILAATIDAFVIGVLFGVLSVVAFRQSETLNDLAKSFWTASPYRFLKLTFGGIFNLDLSVD